MLFVSIILLVLIGIAWYYLFRAGERRNSKVEKKDTTRNIDHLMERIKKYPILFGPIRKVALLFYRLNDKSLEANLVYALFYWLIMLISFVVLAVYLWVTATLWYIAVLNIIIIPAILYMLITSTSSFLITIFNNKLPYAYKLVATRYSMEKDIRNAIRISIPDVDPPVQRMFNQILEALAKTNRSACDAEMAEIDKLYNNTYVTVFLTVVNKAYFTGGDEIIRHQLEEIIEDVYFDTENETDLVAAGQSYIFFAVTMIPGLVYVFENMGKDVMADLGNTFYESPQGALFKTGIIAAVALYVVIIRIKTITGSKG